ncbi:MAG: hypothetical protein MUP81_02925 [Dehalococcoidia bacterium]|nr:hypothetical protein [Dehalococcoidia bacterium]
MKKSLAIELDEETVKKMKRVFGLKTDGDVRNYLQLWMEADLVEADLIKEKKNGWKRSLNWIRKTLWR